MPNYIYSTASQSTDFAIYAPGEKGRSHNVVLRRITIQGGANVAKKFPAILTPRGVVTQVSDEDLKLLEQDVCFKLGIKHGYYTVEKKKADPNRVAKNMNKQDNSAPLTPEDPRCSGTKEGMTKGLTYIDGSN